MTNRETRKLRKRRAQRKAYERVRHMIQSNGAILLMGKSAPPKDFRGPVFRAQKGNPDYPFARRSYRQTAKV